MTRSPRVTELKQIMSYANCNEFDKDMLSDDLPVIPFCAMNATVKRCNLAQPIKPKTIRVDIERTGSLKTDLSLT